MERFPRVSIGDTGKAVVRAKWWLAGKNRYHKNFNPGPLASDEFDDQTGRACQRGKWFVGFPTKLITPHYGPDFHSYLVPKEHEDAARRPESLRFRAQIRRLRKNPYREPVVSGTWPFQSRKLGVLNGCPFRGTHTLGDWESDNAVDLNVPVGTPVIAIWDGVIGSQIGALDTTDPHKLGLRLHLQRSDGRDSFYAHLSKLFVHAEQHVRKGELLGLSGSANSVPHLHISVEPPGRPDDLFGIHGCG